MASQVQQVTYVNTGDEPLDCFLDARAFFARVGVADPRADALRPVQLTEREWSSDRAFAKGFTEATVKLNTESKGDGKAWRGRFVYHPETSKEEL